MQLDDIQHPAHRVLEEHYRHLDLIETFELIYRYCRG
jgi:hypothetical protein